VQPFRSLHRSLAGRLEQFQDRYTASGVVQGRCSLGSRRLDCIHFVVRQSWNRFDRNGLIAARCCRTDRIGAERSEKSCEPTKKLPIILRIGMIWRGNLFHIASIFNDRNPWGAGSVQLGLERASHAIPNHATKNDLTEEWYLGEHRDKRPSATGCACGRPR
jgi:hypothetical protein